MDQNVLYFFDGKPEALPLYEAFEEKVFSEVGGVKVKVQKTQIAFSNGAEGEGEAGGLYCRDLWAWIPCPVPAHRCGGGAVPRTFHTPCPGLRGRRDR